MPPTDPATALAAAAAALREVAGARGSATQPLPLPRDVERRAVRATLQALAAVAPGRSVEVRVPPHGAVQAVPGTTHRRGTPPALVETDAATWLALADGSLPWHDAVAAGRVRASGERSDLSAYLPLLPAGG